MTVVSRRLTLVGKGGTGKSTIAGTLARVLAHRGHRVLALDADTVAGLALAIGIEPDDAWPLTAALADDRDGDGVKRTVVMSGTPEEVVERVATVGPDGLRFLQYGKPRAPLDREQRGAAAAFLELVRHFDVDGWTVVTDLAAGTRQAYYRWTGSHDTVLVAVRPGASAALTARRLGRLREGTPGLTVAIVGNGVRDHEDRAMIEAHAAALGLPVVAMVPHDPAVEAAARRQLAPFDHAPDAPAVRAIRALADHLTAPPTRDVAPSGRDTGPTVQ